MNPQEREEAAQKAARLTRVIVCLVGLACLSVGLALWSAALSLVVVGGLLIIAPVVGMYRADRQRRQPRR
jgi:hypothetical protein